MLKSLRNRLIFSHILPLLIIIPLMGIVLVYVFENLIYLPNLAEELEANALLLANTTTSQPELWLNPQRLQSFVDVGRSPQNAQVMFISPSGILLASSDPADQNLIGLPMNLTGVNNALEGKANSQIHYSPWLKADVIDVLVPAMDSSGRVLGIVRFLYHYATVADEFFLLRYWITGLVILGLVIGSLIGLFLAQSIEKPIKDVTIAVDELAHGSRTQLLRSYGPEETQKLSEAVNFLVTRLRELEHSRRQLLANLVHELGRPLGAMRSAIQALSKGAEKDPLFYQELVSGMDQEAERLQNLLEGLAHLHDQVLGPLELDHQAIQVQNWLPALLRTWQEAAREKKLHWEMDITPNLPEIMGDPDRLAQVIGNLISNAIKFTPVGGQVTISAYEEDGEVALCIADTGLGITPEERAQIFKPFYRGTQGRRFPQGMGLGLSIAYDLVKAHGGRLEVESEPGEGSRFILWMPANSSQTEEQA
jgi:two-component system, OmpR family, sensor histidine kinase BaeS